MATETRYDNAPTFKVWRGYNAACGSVFKDRWSTFQPMSSYVTSYRGDVQYIQIGSKRRKVFHPFERWKIEFSPEKQTGYTCPEVPGCGSERLWGENFMVKNWLDKMPVYPNTTAVYYYGDCCPFVHRTGMINYGNEIRDFVIRDLYIKANAPTFDGAVFVAELDETLKEIHRIFKGAAAGLLRRGRKSHPIRNIILNPEDMWLWWRYFLMPAMMDAEDLMAALKGRTKIDRVQDGDRSDGYQELNGTGYYTGAMCMDQPCQWRSRYKYGAGGAIDMYSRFDPHPWGTSSWDVVRATWERIPWSFVFDWFVNVGDWLASLREIEIEYAQSYATYAIEAETKVSFPTWVMDHNEVTINTLLISRIINLEPPIHPLVDKNWQNVLRTLDLISLTVGTIKSVLKRRK
jgi:hypothetical protein